MIIGNCILKGHSGKLDSTRPGREYQVWRRSADTAEAITTLKNTTRQYCYYNGGLLLFLLYKIVVIFNKYSIFYFVLLRANEYCFTFAK